MKPCTYCGRENEDESLCCTECGTQSPEQIAEPSPQRPVDLAGPKFALLAAGSLFVIVALYLLSFGPVNRLCVVRIPGPPPLTLTNQSNATFVVSYTVTYPSWVEVVYYPALQLLYAGGDNSLEILYGRYVSWWEQRPGSEQ